MNILVVGSGGREHALAWKIAQSPRAERVFVAPGNAGTALDAENVDIPATDVPRLLDFARQNKIDFTVIGPEAALAAGIVDAFQDAGLRAFGPSRIAAELETSKVFCKNLLRHADVPTADYRVFRDARAAVTFLKDRDDVPVVVKADGLASGKGVIVCDNREQALEAIERIAAQKGIRRGRQSGNHRRDDCTDKKLACWPSPTATHYSRCRPARTTNGPTTATRDLTPVAWAPIALPR